MSVLAAEQCVYKQRRLCDDLRVKIHIRSSGFDFDVAGSYSYPP